MPSIFVFDAYGTLFDVHAAIARFRAEAGPDADRMSEIWRSKQLEYTWTLTLAGHYVGFLDADRAGARLRAGARAVGAGGAASRNCWMPISSSTPSPTRARRCARSRRKGHKTGILSNGSPAMLKGAVDGAGLGGDLDAVLSVDAVKMFKPRPEVYRLVTDHFKCQPGEVTFVSSNRWDVMAGTSVGFRSLWINRGKAPDEYPDFPPAQVLADLGAIAAAA